jgi:hypothetical protein
LFETRDEFAREGAPIGRWSAFIAMMDDRVGSAELHQVLLHTWGRVRWKIAAIIVLMATSTILTACLGVAALNVVNAARERDRRREADPGIGSGQPSGGFGDFG